MTMMNDDGWLVGRLVCWLVDAVLLIVSSSSFLSLSSSNLLQEDLDRAFALEVQQSGGGGESVQTGYAGRGGGRDTGEAASSALARRLQGGGKEENIEASLALAMRLQQQETACERTRQSVLEAAAQADEMLAKKLEEEEQVLFFFFEMFYFCFGGFNFRFVLVCMFR